MPARRSYLPLQSAPRNACVKFGADLVAAHLTHAYTGFKNSATAAPDRLLTRIACVRERGFDPAAPLF